MSIPNPPRWLRRIVIALTIRRLLRGGIKDRLRPLDSPAPASMALTLASFAEQHLAARSAVKARPAKYPPGRQAIRIPASVDSLFGGAPWSLTPPGAHEAPWEDCHTFPKGGRPVRGPFGLQGDPAIALVCPGCDLAQPPMQEEARSCGYCGLNIRRQGSRLYWWRVAVDVEEWKPSA